MTEVVIKARNIGKRFQINSYRSESLRESLSQRIEGLIRFGKRRHQRNEFWALKDVSFDVRKGEAVGIIGRNGAGKSTLLKILSRITQPTLGRVEIEGRVSSLLEVGTGFHPELTGKENIYLNGTILGMSRKEVSRKFDEIVEFSGVEKFISTPVKHYSSGMKVRLAFSVAAHLEPEILLIDEVLAVGDASFQRKCLQKMEGIRSDGRTVFLVSHNLSQVQSLCKHGILLEGGKKIFDGDINQTIGRYVGAQEKGRNIDISELPRVGIKSNDISLQTLKFGSSGGILKENDPIQIELGFQVVNPIEELVLGFSLTDMLGNNLVECRSTAMLKNLSISTKGHYRATAVAKPKLAAGIYNLNVGARCWKGHLEYVPSVARIEIIPRSSDGEEWNKPSAGFFITESEWEVQSD